MLVQETSASLLGHGGAVEAPARSRTGFSALRARRIAAYASGAERSPEDSHLDRREDGPTAFQAAPTTCVGSGSGRGPAAPRGGARRARDQATRSRNGTQLARVFPRGTCRVTRQAGVAGFFCSFMPAS